LDNKNKLSDFVQYKLSVDNITIEQNSFLHSIENAVGVIDNNPNVDTKVLKEQNLKIINEIKKLEALLENTKDSIRANLRSTEKEYLRISQSLYEMDHDDYKWVSERKEIHPIAPNEVNLKKLIHEVSEYCSWRYPGMIVRPLYDEIFEPFKSLDPLYVVDNLQGVLDNLKSNLNPQYNNRLRYSTIDDNSDLIFKKIPKKQLGYIFVCDFFNFKSLDMIKKYCFELFELLRPGGHLTFTYNNCDLPNAVRNFEHKLYTYTPASLIVPMLEMIGFEMINKFDDITTNTNWITVKKPGTLKTIRGGQTLAQYESKDQYHNRKKKRNKVKDE